MTTLPVTLATQSSSEESPTLIVTPFNILEAERLVVVTAAIVCAPVRYVLAAIDCAVVDGWNVFRPYYGGTDAAASYTAATVAALLQRYPFYKWHPEVVKALLITSSIKAINNASSYDSDNEGKYAMGIPKGEAMFVNNRSRFWNGKNSDFFSSGYPGVIEFTESNINPNKKYRIAIAWLSRGSVVYDYEDIPQDIDLEVWQNGSRIGYSDSWHNSFEFTEVSPTTSADLTIKIKRYNNIGGRVLLGYNLVEVNK